MYPCPCCGYLSFSDLPGSYEICPICFWEDDDAQLVYPFLEGANRVSLAEAQVCYSQFGACERGMVNNVRPVDGSDQRDPDWFPLWQHRVDLPDPATHVPKAVRATSLHDLYYWLRIRNTRESS